MNDKISDKAKMLEILNDVETLKQYGHELAENTRGEKLEDHINQLLKNITLLNNKVEDICLDKLNTEE